MVRLAVYVFVVALFQIIDGLNPTHLKLVDTQLEELNPTGGDPRGTKQSNLSDYPYRFLGPVLQCSFITLLRDTLTGCRLGE